VRPALPCPPAATLTQRRSVPFFYEPAFAARVAPLPAALRLQTAKERAAAEGRYAPVTYGEFLLKKVGANFDLSGGKDAAPAARY
jgi:isopenicillin N synthase-like dioxygenase